MLPYVDESCKCHTIKAEIEAKYPDADWNMDKACEAWFEDAFKLKDNHIDHGEDSDAQYGCTCPTCGSFICGWCV